MLAPWKKSYDKPKSVLKSRDITLLRKWEGGVGGRLEREKAVCYAWLIRIVVQQKLMQHCKAIIFQLQKTVKNKKEQQTAGGGGIDPALPGSQEQ